MTEENCENIRGRTDVFIASAPVTHASSVLSHILEVRECHGIAVPQIFSDISFNQMSLIGGADWFAWNCFFFSFLFFDRSSIKCSQIKDSGCDFVCAVSRISKSQSEQFIFARYSVFAKYQDPQCGLRRDARIVYIIAHLKHIHITYVRTVFQIWLFLFINRLVLTTAHTLSFTFRQIFHFYFIFFFSLS